MKIKAVFLMMFCTVLIAQDEFVIPQSLLDQVEQGNHEVAYFIANSFMKGSGSVGEVDKARGLQWLQKASDLGSAHAMHDLAEQLSADDKKIEALGWYQNAVELGFAKSFEAIAHFHYMGYGGLDKDCTKAYEWYEKAQAKGVELAYNNHAWYLTTSAEKKCRNPEKAVVVFSQLKALYGNVNEMPWSYRDTQAAVLAGIADFSAAIKLQELLVEDVLSYDSDASQFEVHLERLRQRKPWIALDSSE